MKENILLDKTFAFSVRVVNAYKYLQKEHKEFVLSKQFLRSGTSIGANVEESQAAQSRADFLNKLSIACKEARETHYWLRLLAASDIVGESRLTELLDEADQLIAILTTITKRIRNSEL